MRRVVDDEVDARQVLERADVAPFPADDAALHVVGGQLDHADRRLRRVARRDALQRVGDEVARAALRLGPRLLLEHADAARELVADQLLAALEQVRLRLLQGQAGDALELDLLGDLHLLQLVLELAEMDLAIGEALVLPGQLDELPLDLLLLREHALLDLQHRLATVGELGVDLRAQLDGLLAGLDLRLAAERLGLALGVLDQLAPDPSRLADAGRAEDLHREQRKRDPCGDSDGDSDPDQHEQGSSVGLPHPSPGPRRSSPEVAFSFRARARARSAEAGLPCRHPPSSGSGESRRQYGCH